MWCAGYCSKIKVSRGIKPFPPQWARTCTPHIRGSGGRYSICIVASVSSAINIQTVHTLQLDSAGTDHCPRGEFFEATLIFFQVTWPGITTVTPP
jgi:hypothetical protein